jgi:hypothetical protein
MLAGAAIAAIGMWLLGVFWLIRRHPNPADPNDEWLAATFGLSAVHRLAIRAAVMEGKVVDPDELRPAAVAYARRLRERGGLVLWLSLGRIRRAETRNLYAAPGPSPQRQAAARLPWWWP